MSNIAYYMVICPEPDPYDEYEFQGGYLFDPPRCRESDEKIELVNEGQSHLPKFLIAKEKVREITAEEYQRLTDAYEMQDSMAIEELKDEIYLRVFD